MDAPSLDDVLAAMRAGVTFQIGGGRCFETFAMKEGRLVVIRSDDGFTEDIPIDEAWLRDAIARSPKVFAQYLAWWREGR